VSQEIIALKKELAAAKAEIEVLKMRLKNAELMYRFAAAAQLAPKKIAPRYAERN
jgi:hypothetical protein